MLNIFWALVDSRIIFNDHNLLLTVFIVPAKAGLKLNVLASYTNFTKFAFNLILIFAKGWLGLLSIIKVFNLENVPFLVILLSFKVVDSCTWIILFPFFGFTIIFNNIEWLRVLT